MQKYKHLAWHRATAEEILAVFQAEYAYRQELGQVWYEDEELKFEMDIADWRRIHYLEEWEPLALSLNDWFQVDFELETWRQTLLPENEHTLREVCELLAMRAWLAHVNVRPILGPPCRTGSTFLAMCELLDKAGLPTQGIRPSTPLAEYALHYPGKFYALLQLEPHVPLAPDIHLNRGMHYSMLALGLSVLMLFISHWFGGPLIQSFVVVSSLISFISALWFSQNPPDHITFGDLVTFGDMARLIAEKWNVRNVQG